MRVLSRAFFMGQKMKILDLFAGIGGERRRELIESRGHELITLDLDAKFNCTISSDIFDMTVNEP